MATTRVTVSPLAQASWSSGTCCSLRGHLGGNCGQRRGTSSTPQKDAALLFRVAHQFTARKWDTWSSQGSVPSRHCQVLKLPIVVSCVHSTQLWKQINIVEPLKHHIGKEKQRSKIRRADAISIKDQNPAGPFVIWRFVPM